MTSVTVSYANSNLPVMPMTDVPVVDSTKLVVFLRSSHLNDEVVGMAAGESLQPAGCLKVKTGLGDVDFKTTLTTGEGHNLLEKCRKEYFGGLPPRLVPYYDRYLWVNHRAELLSPMFEATANFLATVSQITLGLVSVWREKPLDLQRAVIWLDGKPQQFHSRHLVYFLLAVLPEPQYRYVVNNFDVLGQGFMRYWMSWIMTNPTIEGSLNSIGNLFLAEFNYNIGVYTSGDTLKQLRIADQAVG